MTLAAGNPVARTSFRAFCVGQTPPVGAGVLLRKAQRLSVQSNATSIEAQLPAVISAISSLPRAERGIELVWIACTFFLRSPVTKLALYNGSAPELPDNRPVLLAALRSGTLDLGAQPDRLYGTADSLTTVQRLAPAGAAFAALSPPGVGTVLCEGAEYAFFGLDVALEARKTVEYRAFVDAICDRDGFARLSWAALAAETVGGGVTELHPAELTHAMNVMQGAIERCLIDAGWFTASDLGSGATDLVVFNAGLGHANLALTTTGWASRFPRTMFRIASSYLYQLRVDKVTGGNLVDQSVPLLEAQAREMVTALVDPAGNVLGNPRHKVNFDGSEAGGLTTAAQIAATKRTVREVVRGGQAGLVFWSANDNAEHTSMLGEFNTVLTEELPTMALLDPTTLSSAKVAFDPFNQQTAAAAKGADGPACSPYQLCKYNADTTYAGGADYNAVIARLVPTVYNGATLATNRAINSNQTQAPTISAADGQAIAFALIPANGGCSLFNEAGTQWSPTATSFSVVASKTANRAAFSGSLTQPDEPLLALAVNEFSSVNVVEIGQDGATGCWYSAIGSGRTKTVSGVPVTSDKQAIVISLGASEIFIRVSGNIIASFPAASGSATRAIKLNTRSNGAGADCSAGWNVYELVIHDAALTSGQAIDIIEHLSAKHGVVERKATVVLAGDSWMAGNGTACANDTVAMGIARAARQLRVVNKGVSGALMSTVDSIKAQFSAAALRSGETSGDPWAVVLCCLMNHVWPTTPTNTDTPAQIAAWMESVGSAVKAAGGRFVVLTLPTTCLPSWIESTFTTQNTRRLAINAAVRASTVPDLIIDLDDPVKFPGWQPTPLATSPTATQVFNAARAWVNSGRLWRGKQSSTTTDHTPANGTAGVDGIHLGLGQLDLGELIAAQVAPLLAVSSAAQGERVVYMPFPVRR